MSVDVTALVDVIADVASVGGSIFLVLVLIKSQHLIKDFFIGLFYGDPNDPSNYQFDNQHGKFDSDSW